MRGTTYFAQVLCPHIQLNGDLRLMLIKQLISAIQCAVVIMFHKDRHTIVVSLVQGIECY